MSWNRPNDSYFLHQQKNHSSTLLLNEATIQEHLSPFGVPDSSLIVVSEAACEGGEVHPYHIIFSTIIVPEHLATYYIANGKLHSTVCEQHTGSSKVKISVASWVPLNSAWTSNFLSQLFQVQTAETFFS